MTDELSFEEWCKALAEEVRLHATGPDDIPCHLCFVLNGATTFPEEEVRESMDERGLWPGCEAPRTYAEYMEILRDRIRTWAPAGDSIDRIPQWWEAFRCTGDNDSGMDANLARAAWLEAGAPSRYTVEDWGDE